MNTTFINYKVGQIIENPKIKNGVQYKFRAYKIKESNNIFKSLYLFIDLMMKLLKKQRILLFKILSKSLYCPKIVNCLGKIQ